MCGNTISKIFPNHPDEVLQENRNKKMIFNGWMDIVYGTSIPNRNMENLPFIEYFYIRLFKNHNLKDLVFDIKTKHEIIQQFIYCTLYSLSDNTPKLAQTLKWFNMHLIGRIEYLSMAHTFLHTLQRTNITATVFHVWAKSIYISIKKILATYKHLYA